LRRYTKTKLDANQSEIISEVIRQGVNVVVILDPVDTFMHDGKDFGGFVEIKVSGRSTYTKKQLNWIAGSGPIPVAIVKNSDEAMAFLKTKQGLTQEQKNNIALFLLGNSDANKWNSEQVERAINGCYSPDNFQTRSVSRTYRGSWTRRGKRKTRALTAACRSATTARRNVRSSRHRSRSRTRNSFPER
jgi:hypothetical protein